MSCGEGWRTNFRIISSDSEPSIDVSPSQGRPGRIPLKTTSIVLDPRGHVLTAAVRPDVQCHLQQSLDMAIGRSQEQLDSYVVLAVLYASNSYALVIHTFHRAVV